MSTKKSAKSKSINEANNKLVDLLDEDTPIAGQKFVCLSFISPEDIINDKKLFYFEKFINQYDFTKSINKFSEFLQFISYKYNIDFNKLNKDMEEFVIEEKEKLKESDINNEYKTFLDINEDKLQTEFNEINEFQTNTRGIKVRGSFESQQEAEMKCKMIREKDPSHDVYVGQVGMWMPFHPEAYKTGKVEYLEKELNELMHKKKQNDEISKDDFKQRVKDAKKKAIEENIEKASKEGNKLMQSIDEEGNLVNRDKMDIPGKNLLFGDGSNDDEETSELRKELFNSDNVVMDKNSDHGLSELLERQKEREKKTKTNTDIDTDTNTE